MGQSIPSVVLKFKGLKTAVNPFTTDPGACEVADECVFLGPDLVGPRRGVTPLGNSYASILGASRVFFYNGVAFFLTPAQQLVNVIVSQPGHAVSGPVSFAPPDASTPVRTAYQNGNVFLTSAAGIQRISSAGVPTLTSNSGFQAPTAAGVPPSPYVTATVSTGSSGADWLAVGSTTCYRVVIQTYDAANNLLVSSPTARLNVANGTAGMGTPSLQIRLPNGLTTSHRVQVFRAAAAATGEPGDEMGQVGSHVLTSADISAGVFTFQDTTPDTFIDYLHPLYTNANSGVGIDQANDVPPFARDIAVHRNRMLYANTVSKQRFYFQLLGVGGSNGLQLGDTITIGGVDFSPSVAPTDYTKRTFLFQTSGTAGQNIEFTARQLCQCVTDWFLKNPKTGNGTAYRLAYVSAYADVPGKMMLEESGINGTAAPVQCATRGLTAFSPPIATAISTSADVTPARLHWSNYNQPEAVPVGNYVNVGAGDKPILRVVPTQDAIYIFKADGLFRISGEDPATWSIQPFDTTAVLFAPETAVAVKSSIFCLLTSGPALVTAAGVQRLANPLKTDFRTLKAQAGAAIIANAFGIAYETEGRYILAMPTSPSDPGASQQFVFDVDELGWTRWTLPLLTAGCIEPSTDRLYLCSQKSGWGVLQENKALTSMDFNDNGAPIASTIKFLPVAPPSQPGTPPNPFLVKDFRDVYLSFRQAEFSACSVGLETETSGSTVTTSQTGPAPSAWGGFAWGGAPWGEPARNFVLRQDVPPSCAQAGTLGLTFACSALNATWQLQGVELTYEPTSMYTVR